MPPQPRRRAPLARLAALTLLAACAGPTALERADRFQAQGAFEEEVRVLDGLVGTSGSPALLLRRARAHVDAARSLRDRETSPAALMPVFFRPEDRESFLAHYRRAGEDLAGLLERYPRAPEAPEAQFLLASLCDAKDLACFDQALAGYRLTAQRYPGTPAAARALERAGLLERYKRGLGAP